ncbi:chemotaxis protein CheB [Sediminitomix flava]|uniref:Two-component system CheB/CheR fusion protein n=1 Tax=Sediminitomix flava TaxID=379075 RepID=A0A315Z6X6_SEDFL|nr:chemotaxis protein CheB [Sediminitomix flava]PWJ38421.1 two-component system CheB/CheR fusion protein [Sediminitomix flava]
MEVQQNFSIVGIGTSAGGLEALKEFFENVPLDSDIAFVVIQHLSPDYKSLMAELLAKSTELPIHVVSDQMKVEAGNIYLIPPGKNMTITSGELNLTQKPILNDLNHLPIDIFFHSLAEYKKESAVGIILSGTGSDGTKGIKSLKEHGGMVMCQDPLQAKFDGMPQSAINTGLVDYILPVEELPVELNNYLLNPGEIDAPARELENNESLVLEILNQINKVVELDFKQYKRPTQIRRITRRMGIGKFLSVSDYLKHLKENTNEVEELANEFLIGVTRFFRDPSVWEAFAGKVIRELVDKNRNSHDIIKIWSIGCSTGEEVYTTAILLLEEMEKIGVKFTIKIFATDLSNNHLDEARKAIYSNGIEEQVPDQFLKKYFIKEGGNYQVIDRVRKMVIFSEHNVLEDPPFNKMDIVTCRNMLIYFQREAQFKALSMIHYALKLGGYLLLGSSETVGDYKKVFKEIDRKAKIYQNKDQAKYLEVNTLFQQSHVGSHRVGGGSKNQNMEHRMIQVMMDEMTSELDVAGVYIDENFDILHAIGEFKQFVVLPDRGFSINLLQMMPNNISVAINSSVRKVLKTKEKVSFTGLTFEKNTKHLSLNLLVKQVEVRSGTLRPCFLVLFLPDTKRKLTDKQVSSIPSPEYPFDSRYAELEQELKNTRENLQATLEEVETSNEELQATNEELLAANEELQSTNEELQSVNEELHTVNAEYQLKVEELSRVNIEMDNLFKSTRIGTIFLDRHMNIRKITPAIKEQFNLRENDIGRPITHFTSNFGEEDNQVIMDQSLNVLHTGIPAEREIHTKNMHWYLKRIMPYLDAEGKIDGVVISFVDINEQKTSKDLLNSNQKSFENVLESVNAGYWDWNINEGIEYFSPSLKKILGYEVTEVIGSLDALNTIIDSDSQGEYKKALDQFIAENNQETFGAKILLKTKDGQKIPMYRKAAIAERDSEGKPTRLVGFHFDLSSLV